jgi:hypothetical protein
VGREAAAVAAFEEHTKQFKIPSEDALDEMTMKCFQAYLMVMAEQELRRSRPFSLGSII